MSELFSSQIEREIVAVLFLEELTTADLPLTEETLSRIRAGLEELKLLPHEEGVYCALQTFAETVVSNDDCKVDKRLDAA